MSEIVVYSLVAAAVGFLIGCYPPIAEGSRERYVRDNPRLFPEQYDELQNEPRE